MANRELIDNGLGAIGKFPALTLTEQGFTEQQVVWLSAALDSIAQSINGQLSLGNADHATRAGNVNAQWVQQYFPDKDIAVEIPHGLGRKAADVFAGLPDRACRFYSTRRGSWTEKTIWMMCDTDAVTVPLLIF